MEERKNHHDPLLGRRTNEGKEKESRDLVLLLRSSNWQNLPSDLLQLIFNHISSSSIPGLISFSSVCKSWRSLTESSLISVSPPPLLLSSSSFSSSSSSSDEYTPKRSSMSQLTTLIPNLDPRTFQTPISKSILNRKCCGCSHGHLIFASTPDQTVIIANVFSSAEFILPKPPRCRGLSHVTHGVLTAPPSSSSCVLFLIGFRNLVWRRLGGANPEDWSVYSLSSVKSVESVVVFNGKLHVLHHEGHIFVLEFEPLMHWKSLPEAPYKTDMRLADCGGELLLVRLRSTDRSYIHIWSRIQVYRMDFAEGVWVSVQSIGDWCLFMDYVGSCPLACHSPGKWGGETNCIYFAQSRSRRWGVLPLDGTEFHGSYSFVTYCHRWPCPAWVYPSMLSIDLAT